MYVCKCMYVYLYDFKPGVDYGKVKTSKKVSWVRFPMSWCLYFGN
jgi:hypothetical protein